MLWGQNASLLLSVTQRDDSAALAVLTVGNPWPNLLQEPKTEIDCVGSAEYESRPLPHWSSSSLQPACHGATREWVPFVRFRDLGLGRYLQSFDAEKMGRALSAASVYCLRDPVCASSSCLAVILCFDMFYEDSQTFRILITFYSVFSADY